MSIDYSFDSLRHADSGIGRVVSGIDTSLSRFQERLASFGSPWGNDMLGSVIGEIYQGALAMAINCYHSNLDAMDDYAGLLSEVADTMATDSTSASTRLSAVILDA
jgi:hypothetical protein